VTVRGSGWPMLALTFTATGGAVQIRSLDIQLEGTATGPDAPHSYLFLDADNDGVFSTGDGLFVGSEGNFSGRWYRCEPIRPVVVPEGTTIILFVVLEISPVASSGKTVGITLPDSTAVDSNAILTNGSFPMVSERATIAATGGRSTDEAPVDDDQLPVSMYIRAKTVAGKYEPGNGTAQGRAPTGGWPEHWTFLTNDSDNVGNDYDDLDIRHLYMNDTSTYIYFNISLESMANLHVNDEWNFYFKTYDAPNNINDMWYRVSLRCINTTNSSAPNFNATLSSYTGSASPPDRSDTWTTNETITNGTNSSDGNAFGYLYDKANLSVLFYVKKASIYGNLLDPGDNTSVYADTWYTDKKGRWSKADRAPNRNSRTITYTMVPEFQDILLPVAGSFLVFVVLRDRARRVRPRRAIKRYARRLKR
jgi:hypothetical protein